MPILTTNAIVLHAFDYLESSRILRLVTRDAGVRSAVARGARRSRRRFTGGLDLFSQGTASFHVKPGRDLDTLTGFEGVTTRSTLGEDLERFAGAETIAEIVLRLGAVASDAPFFDVIAAVLDRIASAPHGTERDATLAGAWQIVSALGHAPSLTQCAECGDAIDATVTALFAHAAGGVLCPRCASLSAGGRKLPAGARATLAAWIDGQPAQPTDAEARAHQRLLREFIEYHLHDGRALRAYDLWEGTAWSAA